jgi:hypothetical protein
MSFIYDVCHRRETDEWPHLLIFFSLSPLFAGDNKMSSLDIRLEGREKEGYAARSELQPTLEQNE